jgi:ABC-type nitrate/sulfonate/bicarbonate transport system permease component
MTLRNTAKSTIAFLLVLGAIVLAWEAVAQFSGFNRLLFPPPQAVAERLWSLLVSGEAAADTLATLGRMAVGYAIAIVVAVPLGLWMGRSRLIEDLFGPLINFLLPIPILALVPLVILWFGLTLRAYLLLVAVASVPPIAVNAASGSRGIDPQLLRVAAAMNVGGLRLFFKVVFPAALPAILTGLRQGLAMAWRAAIGAEFFSVAAAGLGVRMFVAKDYVQSDVVLSLLIVIMVVSMFLDKVVFAPVEMRTIRRWGGSEKS